MRKETSVYASLFTDTSADAALFAAWFAERESERDIREMASEDEDGKMDVKRLVAASGGYSPDIEAGQIRILSKRFVTNPQIVPFVAVIEKWDADMWLIMPFSPYATPATPGEMDSGLGLMGRKVMQAWNARTIQERLLAKSFLCGELDEDVKKEAAALFRNQLAGTRLPNSFSARRGPAILLDEDPRRDYVAENILRFQPLSTAVKATERLLLDEEKRIQQQERGRMFADMIAETPFLDEEYRLAAGTRRPRIETYDVGGISLDLEYSPEAEEVCMTFYDANDERYLGNNGYGVFGSDQEFLGIFMDGTIRIPAASVRESFIIVDSAGEAVKVKGK
ncbi:MAG: hypothetical protein J5985_03315 [Kiritimatiellae bacterium]|nr:hypothetical protein [Kiritimatiellia bacterium]